MADIIPIPTKYDGYKFKSRIEARWAVFFNELGISYEYEKEGFVLSDGVCYLPDFWIPNMKCWVEIKGQEPTGLEEWKCQELAKLGHDVYLISGPIPNPVDKLYGNTTMFEYWEKEGHPGAYKRYFGDGGWDYQYWWCTCPECKITWMQFNGRAARNCKCSDSDKTYNTTDPILVEALLKARQYSF